MSAQYVLGVDLGTTFTAAAVAVGEEPPVAVPLGSRAATMPTVAYLGPDGEFLVGEAAERRSLTDPDWVVRRFKRRIGDETPLLIGTGTLATRHHAHSLAARMISWVVGQVTLRQGGSPERIVVTHPVGWGPHKLHLLTQSLADLGLDNVDLLSEPQAAAIAFASTGRLPADALLAVYDLGGGTFDASLLRATPDGGFRPVGRPVGLADLGGIDFDDAILAHVLDNLGADDVSLDPSDPLITTALARLRQECVDAKEALSVDTATTVPVLLGPVQTSVRLTRAEFETMISPAIAATVEALDAALDSLDGEQEITNLLLTGGSSRIPLVTQALSAHLGAGVRLDRDLDPTLAVALGAALAARPRPEPAATMCGDEQDDEITRDGLPLLIPAPARPDAEVLELVRPVPPPRAGGGVRLLRSVLIVALTAATTVVGWRYGPNPLHGGHDAPAAQTVQLQEDRPQAAPAVGGPSEVPTPAPTPGAAQGSVPSAAGAGSAPRAAAPPVYRRPALPGSVTGRVTRPLTDEAAPRRAPESRPAIRPVQQPQRPAPAPAAPAAPAPAAPAAAPANSTSSGSTEFHEAPAAPAKPKAPRFTGFGPTAPPSP